jgi:hypothetical protein
VIDLKFNVPLERTFFFQSLYLKDIGMNVGRTVFSQVMDFIPRNEFRRIVKHYRGERRVRHFTCWEQYLTMAFAQLTYRESLRDIETCLRSVRSTLYHSGIRSTISRSTLADANDRRSWKMYRDLALVLIERARVLYRDDRLLSEIESAVYAFDATTIELCLAIFPWARAQNHLATCAGIKLHALLDVQRNIPVFARVSVANVNEVRILDELMFEPGAFYVLDRGFTDFTRLKIIDGSGAFFVIRAKSGLRYIRTVSHPVDKSRGINVDQTIHLVVKRSVEGYPDALRRIKFFDSAKNRTLVFLTNNFFLDATLIAELYRARWKIELFFKWIKQHLRIKAFYGTSPNAVNTQIWIALSIFVLIAIIKKEFNLDASLYTLLQILSVTLLGKEPLNQLLTATTLSFETTHPVNQLNLFDF